MTQEYVMPDHSRKIKKFYKLGKKLGQPGQFGYAVECVKIDTKEKFAIKVINKSKFKLLTQRRAFFEQLREEISIMQKLEHANIISFFDVFEDEPNVYIVMEHCNGGELFDRISAKGSYSEKDAAKVLRQVVEGLRYLHANHIAHCDLKPDNFLFLEPSDDSDLKIIDFGMSKIMKFRKYFRRFCGTPYYVAPEVIDGNYTEACDMWSMGVVMFVMLFGYPPFYVDPNEYHADNKILAKVKKGFDPRTKPNYGPWFPSSIRCSDSAKDLITKLLHSNHAQRLSAVEALSHPWLMGESASSAAVDHEVVESLASFQKACRFKQAVLNIMINKIDDSQMDHLQKQFQQIDKDGNGEVSRAELAEALSHVKSDGSGSVIDVTSIMDELDIDNDGVVSYKELCMASVNRKMMAKEERLWEAFRHMDKDGDGKITVDELIEATKTEDLGISEAKKMIEEVDENGDGAIDYNEFFNLFSREDSTLSPRISMTE